MSNNENMMLACYYEKFGRPEVDKVGMIPRPSAPKEGELLIKVHAASLNPADYKQRDGSMGALLETKFPQVYGFDFSGTVIESKSKAFQPNDQVFGMVKGLRRGSLAEYMIVTSDICVKKPKNVSHVDAASVPLVGITAIMAFRKCGLVEDQTKAPRILILGGAGGVGSIAIQLAKALYESSFVVTTASPGKKTELVKSLGADQVIDYRSQDFEKVLASNDESQLFDAIFDTTGEAKKCPSLLKRGGGLCSILACPTSLCIKEWLEGSDTAEYQKITFGVQGFISSGIGGWILDTVTGARRLTSRCHARGASYAHIIGTGNSEMVTILANLLESKKIRAVIDSEYALKDAVDAIKRLEDGHAAGKVVIRVQE